ncbi:hypothetical protein [Brevibacterium luteolum]|uniref:hypothetical protein n=1 Tax=Brevibacterium luteolum TaxID=199591 RepID=UPI001C24BD06|nr:hypothetical protein [Brevibacterium luteolum]MBU8579020.1 hypothetical protein [Brevibacterium luteolum]
MDTSHDDAQLMVAALSDAQLFRACGHADRGRAAAELTQARRAEAAAPSPDAVREAEARQLQAVLAAVVGRAWRRTRVLKAVTMTLIWAWAASGAAVALGFWLDHRSPGPGSSIGGAAVLASFGILIAAAISRVIELRAADQYRARVIETVLEWASSQPGRLGRGADGLPNFHGGYDAGDWRIYFGAGILCTIPAVLAPLFFFGNGRTIAGIISIAVVTVPLLACAVGVALSYKRMERRQDRACEMIAALSHPSPEARMPLGDLRFFSSVESGITYRSASRATRPRPKGVR